jgi:hypothetical protein
MNTSTSNVVRKSGNDLARGFTLLLGVWLFISAFLWPHSMAQMTNTWICGVAAVVLAGIAMRAPQVRYVNTILSIWLFISAFALPSMSIGTVWNNVIVSVAIFIASLVPSERTQRLIPKPGST